MKFTKLDENSIRCVISRDEMVAYGVQLDDLMDDREKAEGFLRYILQEAKEEVDFHTTGEALNVQLSIMPGGDISLMISDDQNSAIKAMLAQFKDKLKDFSEMIIQESQKKGAVHKGGLTEAKPYQPVPFDEEQAKEVLESASEDDPLEMTFWAVFDDLEDAIRMSKTLVHLGEIPSDLYKFNDEYFLSLSFVQTKKEIAKNVFAVAEYSNQMFHDDGLTGRLKEHGTMMIQNTAVTDLAQL